MMGIWFPWIAIKGVPWIVGHPEVFLAFDPSYAVRFLASFPRIGIFVILGVVVLAITGGEAKYADIGHFARKGEEEVEEGESLAPGDSGRRPVMTSWFAMVLPCLLLNYAGQVGYLLERGVPPRANTFYALTPQVGNPTVDGVILSLDMVVSAIAAFIASQALITGMFSIVKQAIALGFCPRFEVQFTSREAEGQVYIPVVNWAMFVGCAAITLIFRSAGNLAAAYGIAVTGTMAVTTILMGAFAYRTWGWPLAKILAVSIPLLIIDLGFFGANAAKIPEGGWFPIVVAVLLMIMMTTWRTGRRLVAERIRRGEVPIAEFIADVGTLDIARVPGTAVFLFKGSGAAPPALITNTKHNRVVHERVILLSVVTADAATVPDEERVRIEDHGNGFFQVVLAYGFTEDPDVESGLALIDDPRLRFEPEALTYFLGRETVIATTLPGMSNWRERLFALQLRSAASAARFFKLPVDRVVEVGSQVEI
jgi:KUP system potassium uptake protein